MNICSQCLSKNIGKEMILNLHTLNIYPANEILFCLDCEADDYVITIQESDLFVPVSTVVAFDGTYFDVSGTFIMRSPDEVISVSIDSITYQDTGEVPDHIGDAHIMDAYIEQTHSLDDSYAEALRMKP